MTRQSVSAAILVAAVLVHGAGLTSGQVPPPGQGRPGGPPPGPQQPSIPSLRDELVAAPFEVRTERTWNTPHYLPGGPGCPQASIKFVSSGGYAPIVWSLASENPRWEVLREDGTVDVAAATPAGPPVPGAAIGRKPSGPTSRVLRYRRSEGPPNQTDGGVGVIVIDGAGSRRTASVPVRMTRACGAPTVSNVSITVLASPSGITSHVNGLVHATGFDTADNDYPFVPLQSLIECRYPSGLRLACLEGLAVMRAGAKSPGGVLSFEPRRCGSTTPCAIRIPNVEGSGPIVIRVVNPYGAGTQTVSAEFPGRTYQETETFTLPATGARQASVVKGSPDVATQMIEPVACSANPRYLVWRGVTFSDVTGRARLRRGVKAGERVTPASGPEWDVAPGDLSFTMQVVYEVEARELVCPSFRMQ